jgi:hypothetical protein
MYLLACLIILFTYNQVKKWFFKLSYPRTVYILRGVSGSGKDFYIKDREDRLQDNSKYYSEDEYKVISSDDYFYTKDDKYEFNPKELPIAHAECLHDFLTAIKNKIPRIYISNIHSKQWEYNNYIRIANMFGYLFKIRELECADSDTLHYFTDRSVHDIQLNKNKLFYENWESDNEADVIEHNGPDNDPSLAGDSLPYPKKTVDELDSELDKIKTQ